MIMFSLQLFKNKSNKFFVLICCLLLASVHVNAQTTTNGIVGPLSYSVNLQSSWSSNQKSELKAQNILFSDGVSMNPIFAFEHANGGIIYATWKLFGLGTGFAAEELSAPRFPSAWKIDEKSVKNTLGNVPNVEPFKLSYSAFHAVGYGDGYVFGADGGRTSTFGYWVDLPVTYLDINGFQSGLLSFYYRAPSNNNRNEDGITFIKNVINTLKVQTGNRLITLAEYTRQTQSALNTANEKTDLMRAVEDSQQRKTTGSSSVNPNNNKATGGGSPANTNINGANHSHDGITIKANSFCYDNGEIKLPPCVINQKTYTQNSANTNTNTNTNTVRSNITTTVVPPKKP